MGGLRVFSAGSAWERAYLEALRFLDSTEGVLLLGRGIGDFSQEWLHREFLGREKVRVGARIQKWDEWVKGKAREAALSQGKGFSPLSRPAKRDYFRSVAKALAQSDAFYHLKDIWSEERFFSALLKCVDEARGAGLVGEEAIERAKEMLEAGSDPLTREAYTDFWNLLQVYERRLNLQEEEKLDESSLLRLAQQADLAEGGPYFLLGFDKLSLLEVELLQEIAKKTEVRLPLALSTEKIKSLLSAKDIPLEHTAALALRGLATNFIGEIQVEEAPAANEPPPRRLLEAHSPAGEAQASAALARASQARFKELRFVLPEDYFREGGTEAAFREELGLPEYFYLSSMLEHPVSRTFFHVLEMKEKNFALAHGLEFAHLLSFSRPEFSEISSLAAQAGIRLGLADWRHKSEHPLLKSFAGVLADFNGLLPDRGDAHLFAAAVEKIAELCGIGELARLAPDHLSERSAHAALSTILRNALMLRTSLQGEMSFTEWLAELKAALKSGSRVEATEFFPKVQFYRFGDWLPPGGEHCLTVVLGLHSGNEPGRSFHFYFEERARRKLSDFLLPTRVQEDLAFLDSLARISTLEGKVLFSWARHDSMGKEREPSWVSQPLALAHCHWPEVAPLREPVAWAPKEKVVVPEVKFDHFSASLLEVYKECPFKAFAERVLRLEDKVQASELDASRLVEGSIVHKALELYYGREKGKEIREPKLREEILKRCLEEARQSPEGQIEYFKGNDALLEAQFRRLFHSLVQFVEADAARYEKFPFFSQPEVESEVSGMVGPYKWKGKIDRVDLDTEAKKALVIDYKIGANPPKSGELRDLQRFQLQLYMDAAEENHPGYEAVGALYASIATGERSQGAVQKEWNAGKILKPGERKYFDFGGTSSALYTNEGFQALRESTKQEILRLGDLLSQGDFSVTPQMEEDSCPRCPIRPACRIRELRAPRSENYPRVAASSLLSLLEDPQREEAEKAASKGFNPEQSDALGRRGGLVFIEASAGTGKTTVIAERIRRFLLERAEKENLAQATEKFAAISFTEKSAQELGVRTAKLLLDDPKLGAQVAAQAQQQISTIHGFCRRIVNDFPVEAGVSPLAAVLDPRGAQVLEAEALEEFFLFPDPGVQVLFDQVFREFSRGKIEQLVVRLLHERALIQEDIAAFRAGASPERIFPEGGAREALLALLDLTDQLADLFEKKKKERSFLDFQDLESLALKVLSHEHARDYYQKKFELLLVDEFQDTNALQREILEAIGRPGLSNLFVVGDAKQSIYRFRAADVSVFQGLRKEAEHKSELVTLTRNYRSRKEIVEAGNRISQAIFPESGQAAPDFEATYSAAIPERESGGKVALVEYGEASGKTKIGEQREREAKMVAKLVSEIRARKGPPQSIAVLLRKISGNENYMRELTEAGVPYRVGSSRGFYGQVVVTDSIALLRVLYGAENDVALLALLRSPWLALSDSHIFEIQQRGRSSQALGQKLKEADAPQLFAWRALAAHSSLSGILERAYRDYPLGRREWLQAQKLLSILQRLEAEGLPRAEVLERLSAWAGWDKESDASDDAPMPEPGGEGTVQVMTVHAAKGLEFDITILADLTSRLMADNSALRIVRGAGIVLKLESEEKSDSYSLLGKKSQERELAELKRLFYVAVTRAKKEEYIFLPRSCAKVEPAKWANCGHFIRAADLEGIAEKIDGDQWLASTAPKASAAAALSQAGEWPPSPHFEGFTTSSVTQLASFEFCPEFHRRKVVQGWDDQVVALWPKDPDLLRRKMPARERDPGKEYAAGLLRALKIENKERGIALHRVLERCGAGGLDFEQARLWLKEAYEAQGADIESEDFQKLAEHDLEVLHRFLESPLGKELFAPGIEAFPELPFEWEIEGARVQGAIDRVIRKADGSWLVVDYKSSVLEESLEEYRFQVKAYMAAVESFALHRGDKNPAVHGFLVDLYASRSIEVSSDPVEARAHLRKNLAGVRASYTQAFDRDHFVRGEVKAGKHCLKCTYRFHCDLGKQIVVTFP